MGAETLNTIEYFKRTKRKWFKLQKDWLYRILYRGDNHWSTKENF